MLDRESMRMNQDNPNSCTAGVSSYSDSCLVAGPGCSCSLFIKTNKPARKKAMAFTFNLSGVNVRDEALLRPISNLQRSFAVLFK